MFAPPSDTKAVPSLFPSLTFESLCLGGSELESFEAETPLKQSSIGQTIREAPETVKPTTEVVPFLEEAEDSQSEMTRLWMFVAQASRCPISSVEPRNSKKNTGLSTPTTLGIYNVYLAKAM